jgi:excisionase family DNA binding protein
MVALMHEGQTLACAIVRGQQYERRGDGQMQSNEAKFEKVMQAEDPSVRVETRMYTVQEIAGFAGVCTDTIRRQIASGALVAHKVGRNVRISYSDFQAWLEAGRCQPLESVTQSVTIPVRVDYRW